MASIYYAILKEFKTQWERKYFGRTFTPRPQHFKQLKELLTPAEGFEPLELTEVVQRIAIYMKNDYYKVCAHNFSVFVKNFDMFIPPPPRRVPPHVACKKCGEIYRTDTRHNCNYTGNPRKDMPAIPLQQLLPTKES